MCSVKRLNLISLIHEESIIEFSDFLCDTEKFRGDEGILSCSLLDL